MIIKKVFSPSRKSLQNVNNAFVSYLYKQGFTIRLVLEIKALLISVIIFIISLHCSPEAANLIFVENPMHLKQCLNFLKVNKLKFYRKYAFGKYTFVNKQNFSSQHWILLSTKITLKADLINS